VHSEKEEEKFPQVLPEELHEPWCSLPVTHSSILLCNAMQVSQHLCGNNYIQVAELQSEPEITEIRHYCKPVQLLWRVS